MTAERQLKKLVANQQIQYSCASSQGDWGEIIQALPSQDIYEFVGKCGDI